MIFFSCSVSVHPREQLDVKGGPRTSQQTDLSSHALRGKFIFVCAGAVRASSIFPIMSVGLLFLGGLCVAASEFYRSRHNVILSAGIFFVSAGKRVCELLSPIPFWCERRSVCYCSAPLQGRAASSKGLRACAVCVYECVYCTRGAVEPLETGEHSNICPRSR